MATAETVIHTCICKASLQLDLLTLPAKPTTGSLQSHTYKKLVSGVPHMPTFFECGVTCCLQGMCEEGTGNQT